MKEVWNHSCVAEKETGEVASGRTEKAWDINAEEMSTCY
jgi:hypothetical protein